MAIVNTIRSMIFGMSDGFVSIWGLVLGVSAGLHTSHAVILAGLAGAIPAALSMAAGEYLSSKSKREIQEKLVTDIKSLVENDKKAGIKLLRDHYMKEGLQKEETSILVKTFSKDKKLLIHKLQEARGNLPELFEHPEINSFVIFFSFLLASLVPIGPFFMFPVPEAQKICFALTAIGLFIVGASKTKWTGKRWWRSGTEMLFIGSAAAITGYFIGLWLSV